MNTLSVISVAGLAYLAGVATPHVWVWFDWMRTRKRTY